MALFPAFDASMIATNPLHRKHPLASFRFPTAFFLFEKAVCARTFVECRFENCKFSGTYSLPVLTKRSERNTIYSRVTKSRSRDKRCVKATKKTEGVGMQPSCRIRKRFERIGRKRRLLYEFNFFFRTKRKPEASTSRPSAR